MKLLVAENIDILTISDTKLDNTFAKDQFLINGFKGGMTEMEKVVVSLYTY